MSAAVGRSAAALRAAVAGRPAPALADGALAPGYAGIRPKISGPGEPAADFLIQGPADHGVPVDQVVGRHRHGVQVVHDAHRRPPGQLARHQRELTVSIKRARYLALLTYVGGTQG